jgi:hypothetical protein
MNSSHQTINSRGRDGTRILFTLKMAVQEESSSSNNNNIETDDLSTTSDRSTTMGKIMEETKEVKCPNCDLCDGSGRYVIRNLCLYGLGLYMYIHHTTHFVPFLDIRIIGGIGQVLDWWPIKAYRPCPNFINNGGQYTKLGQSLDEIAFGKKNL